MPAMQHMVGSKVTRNLENTVALFDHIYFSYSPCDRYSRRLPHKRLDPNCICAVVPTGTVVCQRGTETPGCGTSVGTWFGAGHNSLERCLDFDTLRHGSHLGP